VTRVSFAVLATFVCAPLGAQEQLTKINVVALDHQGEPVSGLQSADFQIQEDGKTRNIAFFHFTGDQPLQPKKPDGREVSNRGGAPPRATVILIDLLSDRMLSGAIISDQLQRAFKNLESGEGLYLYFLTSGGELFPIHALPKPDTVLTAADGASWIQDLGPKLQNALKTLVGIRPVDDRDSKVRFDLTMHALRELGAGMQLISGRKNLVWVTRGLPLNGRSISAQGIVDFTVPLRVVCEMFQRAEIAVYPVGALLATEDAQTLDEISSLTGGRKYGYGEVGEAVKQARMDSRANYEIAYYSNAEKPDAKHHKLKVTCTHKDVRLETVPGFYDLLNPAKPSDLEQLALQLAIHSPFDATGIGLRASASPDPAAPKNTRFDISIDPSDLMWQQAQDKRSGKILLQIGSSDPMALAVNVTPEQYQAALHEGILLHKSVQLAATVQNVRVIVVDSQLGSAGSVMVPVSQ
jgi:VWFA-related protein